jgi:hypothetical protein
LGWLARRAEPATQQTRQQESYTSAVANGSLSGYSE